MSHWTAQLVTDVMIAAWRKRPRDEAAAAAIGWPALYMTPDQPGRTCLHLYAWGRAEGRSIAEICRELGRDRATFDRRRMRAARVIADALNHEGVPPPS